MPHTIPMTFTAAPATLPIDGNETVIDSRDVSDRIAFLRLLDEITVDEMDELIELDRLKMVIGHFDGFLDGLTLTRADAFKGRPVRGLSIWFSGQVYWLR